MKPLKKCMRCKRTYRSIKEQTIAEKKKDICIDCYMTLYATDQQKMKRWRKSKAWRKERKIANPNSKLVQSDPADFYTNTYLNTPQSGRVRVEKLSENTQRILRKQQADYNG